MVLYTCQIVSCQAAAAMEEFKITTCNPGFNVYQINLTPIISERFAILHIKLNEQPSSTIGLISGNDISEEPFLHVVKYVSQQAWTTVHHFHINNLLCTLLLFCL